MPSFRILRSHALPQRLSNPDTNEWVEPTPRASDRYQTFWYGNQLPGTHVVTPGQAYYIKVQSQMDTQPVRAGGVFGRQLGQIGSASVLARWRAAWNNARTRY